MSQFETVTEYMILPTDCAPDDINAHAFSVYVRWQGALGWTVTTSHREHRLSVKGREWQWHPPARNRRFYYFPTFESAKDAARKAVDDVVANGSTYAQFQDYLASRGTE